MVSTPSIMSGLSPCSDCLKPGSGRRAIGTTATAAAGSVGSDVNDDRWLVQEVPIKRASCPKPGDKPLEESLSSKLGEVAIASRCSTSRCTGRACAECPAVRACLAGVDETIRERAAGELGGEFSGVANAFSTSSGTRCWSAKVKLTLTPWNG